MGASHGHYKPYGAMPFPHAAKSHRFISKFLGATMWFWIFYRVREVRFFFFQLPSKVIGIQMEQEQI